jgi:hypothetical protein
VSCVPSLNAAPVDDKCGVFVSSSKGTASGTGSKESPVVSLNAALALANGPSGTGAIYLCGEAFSEAVTVSANVTIYGALDCSAKGAWAYRASAKTALTAPANAVPILLQSSASGTAIYDLAISAADGTLVGGVSNSSVALIANGSASFSLTRTDIVAGNGAPGSLGVMAVALPTVMPTDPSIAGGAGKAACSAGTPAENTGGTPGGMSASNCNLVGGAGGPGFDTGAPGGNGDSGTGANGGSGGVGLGATVDAGSMCSGTAGGVGTTGPGGAGAQANAGMLDPAFGYVSASAQPGNAGGPGGGGGGGGGARGSTTCTGASGGGGGAGGCGGNGGGPGTAGGSSIGIVCIGATLSLTTVSIAVGKGGLGGDGAPGGAGGPGGVGGIEGALSGTYSAACAGGAGGPGGSGGMGGGGAGGQAIAIAYSGATPSTNGVAYTPGTAGTGGKGDSTANNGADGVAALTQKF